MKYFVLLYAYISVIQGDNRECPSRQHSQCTLLREAEDGKVIDIRLQAIIQEFAAF